MGCSVRRKEHVCKALPGAPLAGAPPPPPTGAAAATPPPVPDPTARTTAVAPAKKFLRAAVSISAAL